MNDYLKRSDKSAWIRLFAIVTMTIDHMGMMLFPDLEVMRVIGRLAFPLFSWMLAEGYFYTSDRKAYLKRLGIWALIAQLPYSLMIGYYERIGDTDLAFRGSILVTLFLSMALLHYRWKALIPVALFVIFIPIDYGVYGVALPIIFYGFTRGLNIREKIFKQKDKAPISEKIRKMFWASIFIIISLWYAMEMDAPMQALAPFSLLFLQYAPESGYPSVLNFPRWFWYGYYPAHIFIITVIAMNI